MRSPQIIGARQASSTHARLRLLVEPRALLHERALVGVAGLLARCGVFRAYALWPDAHEPLIGVDLGHPPAAAWLRATFEPDARAPAALSAASWNALRARGLAMGSPSRLTIEAAERGLGRALSQPRLCTYSPTGKSLSKATCFVFEGQAAAPSAVVKGMPERRDDARLCHEIEIAEALRPRLSARVASALPLPPLWAGPVQGEYVAVQPPDPMAARTGRAGRDAALCWLRAFHAETGERSEPWGAGDVTAALGEIGYSWRRARPAAERAVARRARELLRALEGAPLPRCAAHGDFWSGNLAERGGALRVYDWEWAEPECGPFVDLWTFELAELRQRLERERFDPLPALECALERVGRELRARGLDRRFALATLAPTLSRLAFRVRRATGRPGGGEEASAKLMIAVEHLLLAPERTMP